MSACHPAQHLMSSPTQLNPDNILRFLQLRGEPASTNEIARGLHLKKTDTRPLFKILAKLKKRRAIEEQPGGRYRLPNRKKEQQAPGQQPLRRPAPPQERTALANRDEVKGRLVLHQDGYGFVVPDVPVPHLDGDVFIPRDAVEDAMHGDHVLARIQRTGGVAGAQRAEGRIIRILGRAHPTVVGLFRYGPQRNVVLPYDVRIQHEIEIPRGQELTPGLSKKLGFSGSDETSIRLRRIPRLDELDGAVVNVELLRYPRGGASPTGKVIEILGRPGDLGVDTEIIIRKHHLPHFFSAEVLEEAEHRAKPVSDAELAGREDFRQLPIVTIDGETARDFDDAVYVERGSDGGWRLQVHIADVAHYVRTITALDQEARLRGTSVYFPDRAVPMLPEALSNGMCSLKPREARLVMSALMEFDAAGHMKSSRMTPGVIRSAERMTYTNVNKVIEGDAEMTERYASLARHFRDMKELALLLNARRAEHGSIDFDLPEPVIEFDEEQRMTNITRSERNMKVVLSGSAELRVTPQHYQGLIRKITGKPEERILSYLMLRSLKQARYAAESLGHFALGFGEYTHFTSPIRRYPDLIVHRILKWALAHPKEAPPFSQAYAATPRGAEATLYSYGHLEEIASETSEAERRANGAERELMDWKTAQFMEDHLGDEYDALIISVQKFGCFVELFDVFVEGLIPLSALEEAANARCVYRERDHAIIALSQSGGRRSASGSRQGRGASGSLLVKDRPSSDSSQGGPATAPPAGRGAKPAKLEWHLGDKVRVRAERIDPMRKRVEFALIA